MKLNKPFLRLIALLLISLSQTTEAYAHSSMIEQFPKGNSMITKIPSEVILTFDEELLDLGSGNFVIVKDPNGKEISTGTTVLLGSKISRALDSSEIPGKYSVSYRVVSADGHVVDGSYMFSLNPKLENNSPTPANVASESATSTLNASKPAPEITKSHENHLEGFFLHHLSHIILGAAALLVIGIWAYASRRKWRDLSD